MWGAKIWPTSWGSDGRRARYVLCLLVRIGIGWSIWGEEGGGRGEGGGWEEGKRGEDGRRGRGGGGGGGNREGGRGWEGGVGGERGR